MALVRACGHGDRWGPAKEPMRSPQDRVYIYTQTVGQSSSRRSVAVVIVLGPEKDFSEQRQ
eukprot:10907092-Lingulodinium_polyedra.AAC.1